MSDGYVNHRVVKYDKNGRFLKQVGSEKAGIGTRASSTLPHGIAVDAQGQRLRRRPRQPPDAGVRQQPRLSRPSTTTSAIPGPSAFRRARTSTCSPPTPIPTAIAPGSWDITGEIYKMELDGTILGRFGHASKQLGGFQVVHMMDCRNPNEIIVAEIESWRVQKLILKPRRPRNAAASNDKEALMKHLFADFVAASHASRRDRGAPPSQSVPEISFRFRRSAEVSRTTFIWAKWPAWRPIPREIFSSTRAPAIRRSRSARRGRSRTEARGCSSSIEAGNSFARSGRTRTDSWSRNRCASIRRTTSGSSIRCRAW